MEEGGGGNKCRVAEEQSQEHEGHQEQVGRLVEVYRGVERGRELRRREGDEGRKGPLLLHQSVRHKQAARPRQRVRSRDLQGEAAE